LYSEEFIYGLPVQVGDIIDVTAVKGGLSETSSAVAEMVGFAYLVIDVYLTPVT
jgi:hypothetical protein